MYQGSEANENTGPFPQARVYTSESLFLSLPQKVLEVSKNQAHSNKIYMVWGTVLVLNREYSQHS